MVIVTHANLKASLGALIIGTLAATALSGVVIMQAILYFRIFKNDHTALKIIVMTITMLDLLHSAMLWTADYMYFVHSFGDVNITDHVYWSVGVSIALTAVTTVIVHLFFTYRLFRLSKGNYFICVPMAIIAICRVASAFGTAAQLIRLGTFSEYYAHFRWLFTTGLVLSTSLDIMITSGLCIFLRKSRSGCSGRLDHVLDTMTLYTIENGMITCIITAAALVFWLAKPHALIYLGLHFAISKLYANSFLASINARKLLRARHASSFSGAQLPVFTNRFISRRSTTNPEAVDLAGTKLQITINKTVDSATDDVSMSETPPPPPDAILTPMEEVKLRT